ncbi:hypothetical protein [uncultured Ruminococcus sp.]|uniref:hypothetical protein n=1 Tax=uncultured Ruminococcus sp. TaxID=165186 RepID=UPI000EC2D127|nr:hypothetical protein [uncultured Ruminococcus sp.]HCJ40700.1 hypothetical protein [Ruminococcus sp.]
MEIDISNNNIELEDVNKASGDNAEKEFMPTGIPITSFEYNIKNEEEEEAFTIFQQKYVYKRNFVVTGLFTIVAVMFAVSIIKNPSGYVNWVLCFVSLVMIFTTWFNTFRVKKYLMRALKSLEDDKYRFSLYDDCFKIETVFTEEEKAAEDFVPVKPRVVRFEDISLNIIENARLFIIILRKETIYVLSKRVIEENDQTLLRNKLKEVLGEDYEIKG